MPLGGVKVTTFITVIFMISSIALIVSVVLQDEKSQGLGTISGERDSFFNKSRAGSKEAILEKVTTISAAVFMISALALAAF